METCMERSPGGGLTCLRDAGHVEPGHVWDAGPTTDSHDETHDGERQW